MKPLSASGGFNCTPLFQSFITLVLYLQHMESLIETTSRQAISARMSLFLDIFLLLTIVSNGYMIIFMLEMTATGGIKWLRLIS